MNNSSLKHPFTDSFATRAARKELQKAEAANWPDPEEYDAADEVSPKKAHKFYAGQVKSLRFRLKVSVFLCSACPWRASWEGACRPRRPCP